MLPGYTLKYRYIILIICLFSVQHILAQTEKFTLSGFVKDNAGKELLIGASIAVPKYNVGTVSNNFGFYSLKLPKDTIEVIISYIGFKPKAYKLYVKENTVLNINLIENADLQEVVITGEESFKKLAEQTRMSVIEIPIQQIKDIPALLGEKDVLKVIQLLPGVQKGNEGNSGIYVRGGGPDQNLILLDDAIVYNAYHLFGFFSLFNGDALKNVELTKGGFPARYGGRLSSVIDMRMKEGNKDKIKGEAGIGLIASKFLLEGPIVKNKSSFLISGRRTYIDFLIKPFVPADNNGGYYFYDLNAKANYEFNNNNRLFLSGYFGRDKFYFGYNAGATNKTDGGLGWGNATASLRYNHLYNQQLFSNTSLIFSNYKFGIYQNTTFNGSKFALNFSSGITDLTIKHDIDYRPNNKHYIKGGIQIINHRFKPSALVLKDDFSGQTQNNQVTVSSFENALYVEDDIIISKRLRVNPGLRASNFMVKGSNYFFLEPRLSTNYVLNNNYAVKASYAKMNQFVHLLTNTGAGLPTDLWVPSSSNIKPQNSWQAAAGVTKDFDKQHLNISIEGYYKESNNIISYKEGASFLNVNDDYNRAEAYNWEQNITAGKGWSYGLEFLVQRKTGKISGWIGYTLSWTQLQFDELNFGRKFWARYDRRHDLSIVGIYEIKKAVEGKNGLTFSATWVYGTGNAITLPVSEFIAPTHQPGSPPGWSDIFSGNYVSQYTDRNQFRMAPYHRMDMGLQVIKKNPNTIRTWEFSVYNLYNRYNPYFYYIGFEDNFVTAGNRVLKQVSLFPILPSISYNLKF